MAENEDYEGYGTGERKKDKGISLSKFEVSFESDAGSSVFDSEAVVSKDKDSVDELIQNSDSIVKAKVNKNCNKI